MDTTAVNARVGEITERLKQGERAAHVASKLRIPPYHVYTIAREAGIWLKRGRTPISGGMAYRAHFDRTHWSGAAEELLRLSKVMNYPALAAKFNLGSRQSAHQIFKKLSDDASKPTVMMKLPPLGRPEITFELIQEVAPQCRSQMELEERLNASWKLIHARIRGHRIELPNGNRNRTYSLRRPNITLEKIQWFRDRGYSQSKIASVFHTTEATISKRINRYGGCLTNSPPRRLRVA